MAHISVTIDIAESRIADLLVSAFEGGSGYWCRIVEYVMPEETVVIGSRPMIGEYSTLPLKKGCAVIMEVPEENDGKTYMLDRTTIISGLNVMAKRFPSHWGEFLGEQDDAETADVFLQCCLFGDVVYG